MTIEMVGDRIIGLRDGAECISVSVAASNGHKFIHSLVADGATQVEMNGFFRGIKKALAGEEFMIWVHQDDPLHDKLLKLYERLGEITMKSTVIGVKI
jgi:hypothetical protein